MPWLFSPEMTATAFLKEGRGTGDGFQALSQKRFTDLSLVSWQCLFICLLSFYLTNNIYFLNFLLQ